MCSKKHDPSASSTGNQPRYVRFSSVNSIALLTNIVDFFLDFTRDVNIVCTLEVRIWYIRVVSVFSQGFLGAKIINHALGKEGNAFKRHAGIKE